MRCGCCTPRPYLVLLPELLIPRPTFRHREHSSRSAGILRTSKGFRVAAFRSKHKSVEDSESSDMEEDMEEAPAEDTDADDAQAGEDISWMLRTFALQRACTRQRVYFFEGSQE